MTSMPASRRARAITLAPRLCPSSPGLATSTRIFFSAFMRPTKDTTKHSRYYGHTRSNQAVTLVHCHSGGVCIHSLNKRKNFPVEVQRMGDRKHPRIKNVLPIRCWGTDSMGKPFVELAHTLDVSHSGVRVGGFATLVAQGDVINVQYRHRK